MSVHILISHFKSEFNRTAKIALNCKNGTKWLESGSDIVNVDKSNVETTCALSTSFHIVFFPILMDQEKK